MSKWNTRSGLYKAAMGFTYFIFLVYGLAFGLPTWVGRDDLPISGTTTDDTVFQGLWVRCVGDDEFDFDDCSRNSFGDDWDWMDGVRGCWTGGMFFFVVGVLYSVIENCMGDEESRDYGLTGALVFLAGACGGAGVIVTAAKMEDSDSHGYKDYYWGFMIACIASGLAILLAIVLLMSRNAGPSYSDSDSDDGKRRHGPRAIDYINNYGSQQPYPGYGYGSGAPYEYHNAGYRPETAGGPPYGQQQQAPPPHHHHHDGYNAPPLGNGVGYHHHQQPSGPPTHPYTVYQGSSLPRPQNGYYPSGGQAGLRHSVAESADLSNGFTPTIIQAEHSLGRPPHRGDYHMNGSRPY